MPDFEAAAAEIADDHLDLIDNSIVDPAMREAVVRQMLMSLEARRKPAVVRSPSEAMPPGVRLTGELQVVVEGKRGAESIGWVLAFDRKFIVGGKLLAASRSCDTLYEAVQVLTAAYRLKPGGPI